MPLTPQDQQDILTVHNTYRSDPAITTPNVQWDNDLATGAQSWANNLATNLHQIQHSDPTARPGLGENLAQGTAGRQTPAQLADMWKTQEQPYFTPGLFPAVTTDRAKVVGHYTQLIWNDTAKVGCAIASDGTNDYLVCRYSPQGNVVGVQVPKPVTTLPFKTGDVITLQSDDNRYLSRINRGARDPIEPIKASVDQYCQFTVTVLPDGPWIALTADNGRYLSH